MHVSGGEPITARLVAVATLSAAMLALEIALTRLLALTQFHHFAFLVVSLALLGLGAAGSALAVRPGLARRPERHAAGFALAALAILAVYDALPFDSYAIAWDRSQVLRLALTLVATGLPFFLAGLVIGGLLAAHVRRSHLVYAANLAGSAAGSLAALALLPRLGAEATIVLCAAGGLAAGAMEARSGRPRRTLVALAAALSLLAALLPGRAGVELSPYKALSQALLAAGARHTVSTWGEHGRIDVVESAAIHSLAGLGAQARVPVPPLQAGLTIDGDDLAPITALPPDAALAGEIARHMPEAVGHALRPDGRWLVLDPGGGWSVLGALAGGARAVTVVEKSAVTARTVRETYGRWTDGLYSDDRVRLVIAEPRVALHRLPSGFDVVLPALRSGYHPVTSGAYSLGEDYGTTVEAFGKALDAVSPGGVLVVTRWMQRPPTESLRTLENLRQAMRRRGVSDPGARLAAFRSMRTVTFVASPDPLTTRELGAIRAFAEARGFDLVWLPDLQPEEANRRFRLPSPVYAEGFRALLASPSAFVAAHVFDIRATTDDRPFFHHYFRWRQTPAVLANLGRSWQPFGGSGYFVLVVLLGFTSGLAALLVLLPIARHASTRSGLRAALIGHRAALPYFAALGLGYMFVLIPVSQRAILYLGSAPKALAVVSAALLFFSGLGSLTAPRWRPPIALAWIAVGAAIAPAVLGRLWDATLGWSSTARLLVCVLAVGPLALPIGVPLPAGLQRLAGALPGSTAWAWAVNGSASVVGGIVAVMLALAYGFGAVLYTAAAAYALALLAWTYLASGDGATGPSAPRG